MNRLKVCQSETLKHHFAGARRTLLLSVLTYVFFPTLTFSQAGEGVLGDLFLAKEGGLKHYSSYDSTGGNADFKSIGPGETLVLVDHKGAGVLRRWWLTIAPRNVVDVHRSLIIRCYWDGEKTPSVEVPVSDFFGMGFGKWKDYTSLPLNMTSGGYNSYWPMPFNKSAYITVENRGQTPVTSFYFNIDIRTYGSLANDALYFHAQYKQTISTAGKPITVLEANGRGHYVGTLLSMQPRRGAHLGYLEGDEMIYIDGERTPSIIGTGTEDYFSSGGYYDTGEYGAPFHGVTLKDDSGRINTYRWHIEDPIPFKKSFRFDIEHGGTNDAPGVEYSSVAYWYQSHPHAAFPVLPKNTMPSMQLMKPTIDAEKLLGIASVSGGELRAQDMSSFKGAWGNNAQLWWVGAKPGDKLTLPLTAPADGIYEIIGFFTSAADYGIFKTSINGKQVGHLFDGYHPSVQPSGPIQIGKVELKKGVNNVVIELIGKDARSAGFSDGYLVGVDGFHLIAD
jgi:hypothetical protein